MRSDRYTKAVLTIIAIGLWVLTMTQMDAPEAQARTGHSEQMRQEQRRAVATATHAPTSTKPLRYRIPYAQNVNYTSSGYPDCVTVVSVVNFGPTATSVDVEFFREVGAPAGLATKSVSAGQAGVFITDSTDIQSQPFVGDVWAYTGDFDGYALVNADDPRIIVTAMLRCGDNTHPLPVAITNIPAVPVGATMDYFQAGMPATWTPPMAEVPE
jgi:hypothetical protein